MDDSARARPVARAAYPALARLGIPLQWRLPPRLPRPDTMFIYLGIVLMDSTTAAGSEPRRDYWRLHSVRNWSHESIETATAVQS